jgi:fatty-acyl-CoA synthase
MALTQSYWPADTSEPILETTVGSILRDAAAAAPERTAIAAYGLAPGERRTWTFAELLHDAERTARALLQRFAPGEHIAVWANNIPEWLLLEFGAGLAKLVLVTVNPAYRARELDYVLRQSRAAGLFHIRGFRGNPMAETVAEVRPALAGLREVVELERWDDFLSAASDATPLPVVRPEDPAQIQYTSGTTGFPKGAFLHHRGLTNNARLVMQRWALRDGDVYAHPFPFFHTAGCVLATLGPIQGRATQAFPTAFDPGLTLGIIARDRATHVGGVPTMLIAMMEHPDIEGCDLSSVRTVGSGGALVPPDLVRAIEARFGAGFSIVYGQTEASPVITQVPLDASVEDKAGTIGPPLPQTEVKIIDPQSGAIVAPGAIGELCTRGYLVMHGYFDMAKATSEAIDAEGWLHTGDLATMDERGYCRITGRLKEMVIRGGENLFPAEIEAVLHEHPAIVEAAVVGVPDPRMGEELAAFIRAGEGARPSEQELRTHVRARLAAPKTPRYWIFVDAFPLTGSGKVQKFVLRERWEKGEFETGTGNRQDMKDA